MMHPLAQATSMLRRGCKRLRQREHDSEEREEKQRTGDHATHQVVEISILNFASA
jgi:hypothetical protein